MLSPVSNLRIISAIERFLVQESTGGLLLFGSAALAMVLANSGVSQGYFDFWDTSAGFTVGSFDLKMSLGHWINDGLMAIFFLVIGLEIKRELMVGELSSLSKAAFPVVAALGGMLAPALIFLALNLGNSGDPSGFGIPMATDIAFALGFLMLLGKRVPLALKVFLVSLAVIDDLGAIMVITGFYSDSVDWLSLIWAVGIVVVLIGLNRSSVMKLTPYLLLGVLLWYFVYQSGIHPTIAGVVLALTIPVRQKISSDNFTDTCQLGLDMFGKAEKKRKNILLSSEQQDALEKIGQAYVQVQNPLVRLEHALHPISAYMIMPIFALANAGVAVVGGSLSLLQPVSLGIIIGLFVGKPLGVVGLSFIASKLGWVTKPASINWRQLIGVGMLAGVGLTMSIFISQLAFANNDTIAAAKLAILLTSLAAGLCGVIYLSRHLRRS
jgi:NhaA family Na+:H+ antiporter